MDDNTQIEPKWRLAWKIVNNGAAGRDFHGVDLSIADLLEPDLHGAGPERRQPVQNRR